MNKIVLTTIGIMLGLSAVVSAATGPTRFQEVRINLPKPQSHFQINLPLPDAVVQIVNQIQGETSPLLCPAPARNEPVCTFNANDVSAPSNNFDLVWRCDGALRPCSLSLDGKPIGSVRGAGVAHLTLPNNLGIYQMKDRNDRSCGVAVIHGFKASGAIQLTTPSALARTYTEAAYRWYSNTDNATVANNSAVSSLNTTFTANGATNYRLRVLIRIDNASLSAGVTNFKLQQATKGSSCAASTFTDVPEGGSYGMYFQPNGTPSSGDATGASNQDPTDGSNTVVPQTYEENQVSFTSNSTIGASQDGLWDFSLHATNAVSLCLRVVKSDGNALDTYSQYPEVTISGGYGTDGRYRTFALLR